MPAPKNLKVLKLQQPNELLPVMMAYRNALGAQNCDYCHIRGDFASDENPKKEIARKMIGMVQEINEKLESLGIQHTAAAPAAAAPAPAGPGGGPGGAPVVTANIGARAADFVTCYTCHRGQAQPQTVGPPPAPPAGR